MNLEELIEKLQEIEDKEVEVEINYPNPFTLEIKITK